jgi:hypothetical protein
MGCFRRVVALLTLLAFTNLAWATQVQITNITGSVTGRSGSGPEQPLKVGDTISDGMRVQTGPGATAVLRFDDGQIVSLKSASSFSVDNYRYEPGSPGAGKMLLSFLTGGMRIITGAVGKSNPSAFALKSPTATMGIRGTDFMLATTANGDYAQVLDGSISITTGKGTQILNAGQTAYSAGANLIPTTIPSGAAPAGIFDELMGIPLGSAGGGAAAGAGASTGMSAATYVGIGAALAIGIGAAAALGGGGSNNSTTHH